MLLFVTLLTVLLLITAAGGHFVASGFLWDIANALGFAAVATLVYLHIETGITRNRDAGQRPFFTRLHSNIALLGLALALAHGGLLLVFDTAVIEYLKLSAPYYMLAGVLALVVMVLVAATSFPKVRRITYLSWRSFKRLHIALSLSLVALVAFHVVGSSYYLDTLMKKAFFVAIVVIAPVLLINWRKTRGAVVQGIGWADAPGSVQDADRGGGLLCAIAVAISLTYAYLRNL